MIHEIYFAKRNFYCKLWENNSQFNLSFKSAIVKVLKSKLIKEPGSMDPAVSGAN